jgi:hypothetical protein
VTEQLDSQASAASNGQQFVPAPGVVFSSGSDSTDRPEVPVAAAFAGGFLLAMILRRLAR